MRRMQVLAVVAMLVVGLVAAGAAAAAPADVTPLTSDQLIYQGASVEIQVDVNGAAAVQLVGGALDAALGTARDHLKTMKQQGGDASGPLSMLPMVEPALGPVKDALQNLSRVVVVVMKAKEGGGGPRITEHYTKLMSERGWSPLMTVRGQKAPAISLMLAEGGKGLFAMVNDKQELIVAMVTTGKPLGDLIADIVRASGGLLPALLAPKQGAGPTKVSETQAPAPKE